MDKPVRFISDTSKEISKEEMGKILWECFMPHEPIKTPVIAPKDFCEFEDRLGKFEESIRELFFGLNYDIETGKTLKREKTTEVIVEALCNYEKFTKDLFIINEHLTPFSLLKLILEKDAPFVICEDIHMLGIMRDRSGLSLPQKNRIAVQAAAQILWYLEKSKIPTIKTMKEKLLNKKNPLYGLLQLSRFNSSNTIEDWVSKIFPVPKKARKGRPSEKRISIIDFDKLILIPEIFMDEGAIINFLKFRFAIRCFVRVLKTLDWSSEQIKDSDFVLLYRRPLKYYPQIYVDLWIKEALDENGSIFD